MHGAIERWRARRRVRREVEAKEARFGAAALAQRVQAAVADEAREALRDGRAELTLGEAHGFPEVALTPTRAAACEFWLGIDHDHQVTCSTGGNDLGGGVTYEVYSKDPAEIEEEVRRLVAALVAGTYSETEKCTALARTVKARWPERRTRYTALTGSDLDDLFDWRPRSYAPY